MSTSSGREGHCERCGHFLNEHTREREAKCKKCKKVFEICQAPIHGLNDRGWRICFIPCYCGAAFYPDKAKAARPLEPHEYRPEHLAYRPLSDEDDDNDDTVDNDAAGKQAQGEIWTPGHNRVDSGGSEDPLQWSQQRLDYERGISDLVEPFHNASTREESTSKWSAWKWSKEWKQWERWRDDSTGGKEYDYQVLAGSWSKWLWSEEWGCWERSAKAPDGAWGYDYKNDEKEKQKRQGKGGGSTDTELNLVDLSRQEEKKGHLFYYFYNEEGKEVKTDANDWKRTSVYFEGKSEQIFVYVGKKSGRVYHCWEFCPV